MKHLVIVLSAAVLAACATPPQPKKPDESNRVRINKTLPIELQERAE